ncbi:MAG: hypothetical protein ACI8QZ_000143 [Chlamydiales bacterium]|jgi:hypothetical protein
MVFVKRLQKLSKAALQVKMILAFLVVSVLSALFQIYLLNRFALLLSQRLPTDGDLMLTHLPGMLLSSLALTFVVLVPGTFLVGILITHRVAGPVHAIERHLRRFVRGEKPGPCVIRKSDELHELCDLVNQALATDACHSGISDGSGVAA